MRRNINSLEATQITVRSADVSLDGLFVVPRSEAKAIPVLDATSGDIIDMAELHSTIHSVSLSGEGQNFCVTVVMTGTLV